MWGRGQAAPERGPRVGQVSRPVPISARRWQATQRSCSTGQGRQGTAHLAPGQQRLGTFCMHSTPQHGSRAPGALAGCPSPPASRTSCWTGRFCPGGPPGPSIRASVDVRAAAAQAVSSGLPTRRCGCCRDADLDGRHGLGLWEARLTAKICSHPRAGLGWPALSH